jgi:hypothetical protein
MWVNSPVAAVAVPALPVLEVGTAVEMDMRGTVATKPAVAVAHQSSVLAEQP